MSLNLPASQKRLRRPAVRGQIKKNEIGWACGTDRRRERGVEGFIRAGCKKKTIWKA